MKKKCARILQQSSIQSTNHPHDVLKQIIFQSSCTLHTTKYETSNHETLSKYSEKRSPLFWNYLQ